MLRFAVDSFVFSLRTTSPNGLIFFSSQRSDGSGDFVALSLTNGLPHFTFNTGGGDLALESTTRIDDGEWHTITATRNRLVGTLSVDGVQQDAGTAPGIAVAVNLQRPATIYIGGVPSNVRPRSANVDARFFAGCIREAELDGTGVSFDGANVEKGFGVDLCVGFGPCRETPCQNGGTCAETGSLADDFVCECPTHFGGSTCENAIDRCALSGGASPCRNGGTCSNAVGPASGFRCACPYGFSGVDCGNRTGIVAPELFGDSYVAYRIDGEQLSDAFALAFDLRLSPITTSTFQLIAFVGASGLPSVTDHFAMHVTPFRRISVQVNCGDESSDFQSSVRLTEGQWYRIEVKISRLMMIELWIDGTRDTIVSACAGGGGVNGTFQSLDVSDTLYLGGVEPKLQAIVSTVTSTDGLSGCVANLTLIGSSGADLIALDNSPTGADVGSCLAHACDGSPCQNNGTCVIDGATFFCECPDLFLPPLCDVYVDACDPNPCDSTGGVCRSISGEFRCICSLGRTGIYCNESKTTTGFPSLPVIVDSLVEFIS